MVVPLSHYTCENFVTIGVAARTAGVPYQYIFGLYQRAQTSKKRVTTKEVVRYGFDGTPIGKKTKLICLECVIDRYGSKKEQESELLATPIQAYRGWDVRDNQLVSSGYDSTFVWLPDGAEAKCDKRGSHEVPGPRCSCGLYALADPVESRTHNYGIVQGAVELWGRYREGDRGWRAQWGRPVALLCTNWQRADEIHNVASLYRIPVTHSIVTLKETNWGEREEMSRGLKIDQEEVTNDEYRRREEVRRGATEAHARADSGADAGRAACRDAACSASTIQELKFLLAEGIISQSNVLEVFS